MMDPSERVLVRESAPDGSEYVATDLALYHRNLITIARAWRRLAWSDVVAAGRSCPATTLTLHTRAGGRALALRLRDRSRLPAFVDERLAPGVPRGELAG